MIKNLFTLIVLITFSAFVNAQQVKKAGDIIDNIELKSTKGDRFNLNHHQLKGCIVVFITPSCDHCLAYINRISALNAKFKTKGFPVIAIGPYGDNEKDYPYDAMSAMKKLVEEKTLAFPYLSDEKFNYTWLLDIKQTPKAVVLKKQNQGYLITYIGNIDDEPNEKRAPKKKYIEAEVNKLLGANVH